MSDLPAHLEVDLAEYDRGGFDDDFDRCMEFFSAVIRAGGGPWRLDSRINAAIDSGFLSPAGDILKDFGPLHWGVADLD